MTIAAHLDTADGWCAVEARLALLCVLAREVSAQLGYIHPGELDGHIAGYVDTLRRDRASYGCTFGRACFL